MSISYDDNYYTTGTSQKLILLLLIYLFLLLLLIYLFPQIQLAVFNLSLSDSKSPQVTYSLLNILVDFNGAKVWIVTNLFLISNFHIRLSKFL